MTSGQAEVLPESPSSELYLGLDPGLSGALAGVDRAGTAIFVLPMPTLQIRTNKSDKSTLDLLAIRDSLRELRVRYRVRACVEKVHAMPKQGVTAMFNFGGNYVALKMGLICCDIPFQEVTPQAWQKKFLAGTGLGKEESLRVALNRFPSVTWSNFAQAKQKGIADALLIAEYLRLSEKA